LNGGVIAIVDLRARFRNLVIATWDLFKYLNHSLGKKDASPLRPDGKSPPSGLFYLNDGINPVTSPLSNYSIISSVVLLT